MTVNRRKSKSYIGTFDVKSVSDMQQLNDLRQMVTTLNGTLKAATGKTFRLVVKGRKPEVKIVNPRTGRLRSYDTFGDIVGGLANATRLDAYIYERR